MALSAREQQALDAIARRMRADDPSFARRLATFGAHDSAPAAPRRRRWPVAVVVVLMVVGLLLLPQGTAHGRPGPAQDHGSTQQER